MPVLVTKTYNNNERHNRTTDRFSLYLVLKKCIHNLDNYLGEFYPQKIQTKSKTSYNWIRLKICFPNYYADGRIIFFNISFKKKKKENERNKTGIKTNFNFKIKWFVFKLGIFLYKKKKSEIFSMEWILSFVLVGKFVFVFPSFVRNFIFLYLYFFIFVFLF